jgi:hypothetical protein
MAVKGAEKAIRAAMVWSLMERQGVWMKTALPCNPLCIVNSPPAQSERPSPPIVRHRFRLQ